MKNERNKSFGRKNKFSLFAALSIFTIITVMAVIGQISLSGEDNYTFSDGVYINGEQMGGYTVQQAYTVVSDRMADQIRDVSIDIMYKDKIWHFDENDFEINDAVKRVVQNAYNGYDASNINAVRTLGTSRTGNFRVSIRNVFVDFDKKIAEIIDEVECEPINSRVIFRPDEEKMFEITKAEPGFVVDREKLYCDLENQFLRTKDIKVIINSRAVKPDIDEIYFEDKLNLMSKFSTDLKNSQEGRRFNVGKALDKFNGKVVKTGETVSFNEVTGPQTLAGGYKKAVVILNNKFVEGVGGGICQASTTLYNACVLANLEIIEVHKHTLPVGYVELSLDAMVSDGYSDFIFKNTSGYELYFKTYTASDRAYVEIYGKSVPENVTIKRTAEFLGNIPHNGDKVVVDTNGEYSDKVLYKGEYYRVRYPREGYEAKGYKEYYKNGELIKKEEIRHEKYQPIDGLIIEGANELPKGYVLPEQDIEFIKPQGQDKPTNIETLVDDIKRQNPTQFNP